MSAPQQMTLSPWDEPPLEPLPLLHPRDIWAAAKQIDGLGGEWSYLCFSYRALNFHLYRVAPLWFEPLRGFDGIRRRTSGLWRINCESRQLIQAIFP